MCWIIVLLLYFITEFGFNVVILGLYFFLYEKMRLNYPWVVSNFHNQYDL